MSALETEVRALVARTGKVAPEALGPDTHLFHDLGIDSLEGLKLLAELEVRYGVQIPDHRLMEMGTLSQIASVLKEQLARKGAEEPA